MLKKLLFLALSFTSVSAAHAALQIQNWTLANGARVYFVENHTIPIVDLSVEFDAGSRRDPQGKAGTAALTNAMLGRGLHPAVNADGSQAPALNEAEVSDAFADLAAQRGGSAGADRSGVTLRTLSAQDVRERAVALMGRLLAQPAFPEALLARDKARTVAAIRESLTKPEAIAERAFWRLAYQNHPYARELTEVSVNAITRADLVSFHKMHYVANRAVVALIGDLSRAQAEAIAQQLTGGLPQGAALPAMASTPLPQAQEERLAHPASQAHILIGAPALVRGDPDFFPLTVGNYILGGGGFVSRLTHEVRETRGLAYSVYSYFNPMAQAGPFQIGLQTQKGQTGQALKVVRDTLSGFLRDGPSEAELKAAKDNLVGGFALRIDNNRKILDNIAVIGFYDLPLDYLDRWTAQIQGVTVAQIRAAFARKVFLDRMVTVVVGGPA
ncbi:MAG: M16 family metallopeptidase [Janthinobacterium lividum]